MQIADSLTVQFPPAIAEEFEKYCWAKYRELCRIAPSTDTASAIIPFHEWQRTKEGRIHYMGAEKHFLLTGQLNTRAINNMLTRLQSKRRVLQGKKRLYSAQLHNKTSYRAYKVWLANQMIAQYLGVEYSEPCPIIVDDSPPDQTREHTWKEMAERFESFTGVSLPSDVWAQVRVMDSQAPSTKAA